AAGHTARPATPTRPPANVGEAPTALIPRVAGTPGPNTGDTARSTPTTRPDPERGRPVGPATRPGGVGRPVDPPARPGAKRPRPVDPAATAVIPAVTGRPPAPTPALDATALMGAVPLVPDTHRPDDADPAPPV